MQNKSHTLNEFFVAFLIGCLFALFILFAYIKNNKSDITILLHTNTNWELGRWIENDYGEITSKSAGHDTQFFYLIARHPSGIIFKDSEKNNKFLLNVKSPQYRYRRILLPLLAGGFGSLNGKFVLANFVIFSILGVGLITGALSLLANKLNLSFLIIGIPLAYPGVWHSITLFTPDNLCFGLSILAFYFYQINNRKLLILLCALLPLFKETYFLVVVSFFILLLRDNKKAFAYKILFFGLLPIILWSAYLCYFFPSQTEVRIIRNFEFFGVLSAIKYWKYLSLIDFLESYFNLFLLFSNFLLLFLLRKNKIFYIILPWFILACCLSHWVWKIGNNSSRALLPLWVITIICWVAILHNIFTKKDSSIDKKIKRLV